MPPLVLTVGDPKSLEVDLEIGGVPGEVTTTASACRLGLRTCCFHATGDGESGKDTSTGTNDVGGKRGAEKGGRICCADVEAIDELRATSHSDTDFALFPAPAGFTVNGNISSTLDV